MDISLSPERNIATENNPAAQVGYRERPNLDDLNHELESLLDQRKALLDHLAHEKNIAAVDLEAARNFSTYLIRVLKEHEALNEKIHGKSGEIRAANRMQKAAE